MSEDIHSIENKPGISISSSIIQEIQHPLLLEKSVQLFIKRDDLLHPVISGNKWRKLKYIIQHALELKQEHLISMGGAYSNHLHALAYVGHKLGLKTTGLIRGEVVENETLRDCETWGMKLVFTGRGKFRQLRQFKRYNDPPGVEYDGYWIPEGGSCDLAVKGISEIVKEIDIPVSTVAIASGTGTSVAGIAKTLPDKNRLIGFACLKGADFIEDEIVHLLDSENRNNWQINHKYHFGGFAKVDEALLSFITEFQNEQKIPLEPVYTGKLLYGLFDLIQRDYFKKGERILAVHTGGLQGQRH